MSNYLKSAILRHFWTIFGAIFFNLQNMQNFGHN